MSIDSRPPASPDAHDPVGRASMMARVQEQMTTRRRLQDRRCPLCGDPIRGGQPCISLHGTTVHERCRSTSR